MAHQNSQEKPQLSINVWWTWVYVNMSHYSSEFYMVYSETYCLVLCLFYVWCFVSIYICGLSLSQWLLSSTINLNDRYGCIATFFYVNTLTPVMPALHPLSRRNVYFICKLDGCISEWSRGNVLRSDPDSCISCIQESIINKTKQPCFFFLFWTLTGVFCAYIKTPFFTLELILHFHFFFQRELRRRHRIFI